MQSCDIGLRLGWSVVDLAGHDRQLKLESALNNYFHTISFSFFMKSYKMTWVYLSILTFELLHNDGLTMYSGLHAFTTQFMQYGSLAKTEAAD